MSAERIDLKAKYKRYNAPIYRNTVKAQPYVFISAPSPKAAATDHRIDPVVTPAASASPFLRPDATDVPAMASVAGPGLAIAVKPASNIMNKFKLSIIVLPAGLRCRLAQRLWRGCQNKDVDINEV